MHSETDLVALHAVLLAAVVHGLGDAVPALGGGGVVGLHGLLQQLLLLCGPGRRVGARLSQLGLRRRWQHTGGATHFVCTHA